jgi:hypothetical protein
LFNCIQELYRLTEGVSEQVASVVFHNSAQKVVKDAIKHARFQSIAYYHRNVLKQPINTRQAKALNLYLQKEEYVQATVDWLVKDVEAWDSLCEPDVCSQDREGLTKPAKQAVRAPLWCRRTRSESPENGMIHVLTLCITAYKFVYNVRLYIAESQYGR